MAAGAYRGWQRQDGEGSSGGMERAAAVGSSGTERVEGTSVWADGWADMEGMYGGRWHADWVSGSALGGGGSEMHRGGLRAWAWVWTWDVWTWGLVGHPVSVSAGWLVNFSELRNI